MANLGFIGLGAMGSRIADRLQRAGHSMTVYDRNAKRVEALASKGAAAARTPAEVAARSEIVLSCVADDAAVEAVLLGRHGALEQVRPGALIVDLSTVSPLTSRLVADAVRAKDAAFVDAAMSGSTPQAEQGALVIFAGGEPDAVERARPILDTMAKTVFHIGQAGAGTTMKLVVNTLLGAGLQILAEALALGEKAGIDRKRLAEVLGETAVISPAQRGKLANAVANEFPSTFPVRLMYKDFNLVLAHAAALGVPMPTAAVAAQLCAAQDARGPDEDFSATIRLMRQLAGMPA
jgi:3-hydroxyisobutyrate dehydrogenase-like beta-hydroxyacid dehydrogenase